ncbi:MAG: hypothetical protein H7X79_07135 [Sporomusaceae bacterium]|nr:hypothetical protein [Sporomusaceae bacterium]
MKTWLLQYKKFLLVPIILLVIIGFSWNIFAVKAEQALQDNLMQRMNQQLNGRLQAEAIDLSLFGWVKFRGVSLFNDKGTLVAQSSLVSTRYQLSDLFDGKLDLSRIGTVVIEGAEVWLEEFNGSNNWDGLLKDNKDSANFHGKIQLVQGRVHFKTSLLSQILEDVNGFLSFQTNPNVDIDLKGKSNQSLVTLKGNWEKHRPFELALETDTFDLLNLGSLLAPTSKLQLEGGSLKNLKVTARNDEKNNLHYQVKGEFLGLALQGAVLIRDGKGKFSGDQTGLLFEDLSLLIAGQQAQGHGRIFSENSIQTVDFTLSLPSVDPTSVNNTIVAQGPLALQIHVNGPLAEPIVSGSFTLPQMTVSDMSLNTIAGDFHHTTGLLTLQQVQGSAHSGTLFIAGNLLTDKGSYELDVNGQGMDSSQLTDKDVQGPLDFTGHATGQGDTVVTRGDFIIHGGKAYGLPFQTLTGQFVKRGLVTDISGVAIHTSSGTFYPEQLTRNALENINHRQLPTSQEALKKVVTDKLVERLFR